MDPSIHHLHHQINHWAVLVSALILWFLGAAWYSPALFAKPWMAALGITPDPSQKKGLIPGMIASFVGDFILAFVLEPISVEMGVFVALLLIPASYVFTKGSLDEALPSSAIAVSSVRGHSR